jgi:peptide/nickel transport system substrate-binding protein
MKNSLFFILTIIFLLTGFLAFADQNLFENLYTQYNIECGKPGGKLILSVSSDPKSFNPIVAQETSTTTITAYIFEGLTKTDPLTLEVLPSLAAKWETEDAKEWIFYLRKGVFWSDGREFTSRDVVFTFNDIIYNPDIPTSSKDIFTIDGEKITVEAIDDYTVKFKLPFVFVPFLRALSQEILPEHKYASLVKNNKFAFALGLDSKPTDIIGTGPFVLKRYLPGERVELVRNKNYYLKDSCANKLPYLEEIVFIILANPDTALLKFMEGEIDYYSIRPQDLGVLGPLKEKENFDIYNAGPSFGSNFIVFNQTPGKNPKTKKSFVQDYKLIWFQDKTFRQAISFALNRAKIVDILMNGLGRPQYSPLSPTNTYYYYKDIKEYSYNPKRAKELLFSIGLEDRDEDGILEDSKGRKVEINFFTNANDTQRIQIATLIKRDLEEIGIKINFLPLDFNNLVSKLTATFDWEMILIGLTGGIEPYFGKNVWSYKGNLHMWNASGEPIADYEKDIEDIFNLSARTLDKNARKELFFRWQRIAAEQLPLIYTVTPYSIYAVRDKFGNLYPTVYGGAFSQIEHIYIKDKKGN